MLPVQLGVENHFARKQLNDEHVDFAVALERPSGHAFFDQKLFSVNCDDASVEIVARNAHATRQTRVFEPVKDQTTTEHILCGVSNRTILKINNKLIKNNN